MPISLPTFGKYFLISLSIPEKVLLVRVCCGGLQYTLAFVVPCVHCGGLQYTLACVAPYLHCGDLQFTLAFVLPCVQLRGGLQYTLTFVVPCVHCGVCSKHSHSLYPVYTEGLLYTLGFLVPYTR